MIEHHIQRTIIDTLTYADGLRFSELKPKGMESNIFMYHLKQLIKQGYVEKAGEQYRLAPAGLSYVDRLNTNNLKLRDQPKLIAIVALRDKAGRWLLAERKTQPYIGTRMFISGKQHRGESTTQHAPRELKEKTGLDMSLTFRGTADIQIQSEGRELLTHAVAFVYEGVIESAMLPSSTERLQFVWHDFGADSASLMPGTREIYEALVTPGVFAVELKLTEQ